MDQAQQIIEDNSGPASAPSVKDKNGRAHSDIGRDGEVHPLMRRETYDDLVARDVPLR